MRHALQSPPDLAADRSRPTDAKKLNLDEIADRAGEKFDGDGDDRMNGSANGTSAVEIIVSCRLPFPLPTSTDAAPRCKTPHGVPLTEPFAPNGVALPRAGFFLPENPRVDLPALDEKATKAGMQLRNLLNDDAPDEEAATPAGDDWFGGGNGGEGSVTTEDESDAPLKPKSPPSHHPRQQQHHADPFGARKPTDPFAAFETTARRYSDGTLESPATSRSPFPHPSAPNHYPASHYSPHAAQQPERRFEALRQPMPIPLANAWQPSHQGSPSSFPPPYGPSSSHSSAASTPGDFFRRSLDHNDLRTPYGAHPTPPSRPSTAPPLPSDYFGSKPQPYNRPYSRTSAYPPPPPSAAPAPNDASTPTSFPPPPSSSSHQPWR